MINFTLKMKLKIKTKRKRKKVILYKGLLYPYPTVKVTNQHSKQIDFHFKAQEKNHNFSAMMMTVTNQPSRYKVVVNLLSSSLLSRESRNLHFNTTVPTTALHSMYSCTYACTHSLPLSLTNTHARMNDFKKCQIQISASALTEAVLFM